MRSGPYRLLGLYLMEFPLSLLLSATFWRGQTTFTDFYLRSFIISSFGRSVFFGPYSCSTNYYLPSLFTELEHVVVAWWASSFFGWTCAEQFHSVRHLGLCLPDYCCIVYKCPSGPDSLNSMHSTQV